MLQLIAALVILLFGFIGEDDLARAASYFLLMGLPIWATLILLFHQHKLERIESVEADAIARQSGQSSALFEADEDDLNVSLKRLRWMHTFLVPSISVVVSVGLIAIAWWQWKFFDMRSSIPGVIDPNATQLKLVTGDLIAWGLAINVAIAVGCFIFSRYVSGMARQKAWQLLNGGASTVVGSAIVCTILAIAYGFKIMENPIGVTIAIKILPIFTFIVGAEIAARFLLNLYKPRRPGEFHKPAFDSQLLGIVAAPDTVARSISDTVNYQFGFQVTSSWAYQLLARQVIPLVALCGFILVLLNCAAIVRPEEQGVLLSFGKLVNGERVIDSGLVWKLPWHSIERYPVHRIQRLQIGKLLKEDARTILWGGKHSVETEDLIIVGPVVQGAHLQTNNEVQSVVANNYSVLNMTVPIEYRIKADVDDNGKQGLINYLFFTNGGEYHRAKRLRNMATQIITQRASRLKIDDLLGPGRALLAGDLRDRLQDELDAENAGIEIIFVGVAGIHPPSDEELIGSFEAVLKAREQREILIKSAEEQAIRSLASIAGTADKAHEIASAIEAYELLKDDDPLRIAKRAEVEMLLLEAGGESAAAILHARKDRWVVQMEEWVNMTLHNSRMPSYVAAPDLYKTREYLNRLIEATRTSRLIITSPDIPIRERINLQIIGTELDLSKSIDEAEEPFRE